MQLRVQTRETHGDCVHDDGTPALLIKRRLQYLVPPAGARIGAARQQPHERLGARGHTRAARRHTPRKQAGKLRGGRCVGTGRQRGWRWFLNAIVECGNVLGVCARPHRGTVRVKVQLASSRLHGHVGRDACVKAGHEPDACTFVGSKALEGFAVRQTCKRGMSASTRGSLGCGKRSTPPPPPHSCCCRWR